MRSTVLYGINVRGIRYSSANRDGCEDSCTGTVRYGTVAPSARWRHFAAGKHAGAAYYTTLVNCRIQTPTVPHPYSEISVLRTHVPYSILEGP